ncbi:MAG TPA: methionine--tRNA ligase subunit beta [archaeon]|nr:methionine--tRNA ligase subunit beta [archaeon]
MEEAPAKITYEQFSKLEIRIAKILHAEKVEGSDKLLRLEIDLGTEKRQLVAGLAQQYTPEEIIGKQIPVIANLEMRKIRGIESNGMILAADDNGKPVILQPQREVPNGAKVF